MNTNKKMLENIDTNKHTAGPKQINVRPAPCSALAAATTLSIVHPVRAVRTMAVAPTRASTHVNATRLEVFLPQMILKLMT